MTTKKRIEKLERKANPEDDEFRIVWVLDDGTYQVGDETMTKAEYLARYGKRKTIRLKWLEDLQNEDSASDKYK